MCPLFGSKRHSVNSLTVKNLMGLERQLPSLNDGKSHHLRVAFSFYQSDGGILKKSTMKNE